MRSKTVLVVGGGGRESALVEAYAKDPSVARILATPGNDLMDMNTGSIPVETFSKINTTDVEDIVQLCKERCVDLVDVAQDNAVEAGVVNDLTAARFSVIGPSRQAGRIEWDKAFARIEGESWDLPQPDYKVFHSPAHGEAFVHSQPDQRWVVKANGLAEGKGVIIADDRGEAIRAIQQMKRFGKRGETFLIEKFLQGKEFSSYALSDGKTFTIIGHAQDHKRAFDADKGPNTGGMGCSTPPLVITSDIERQIEHIFKKTFAGLQRNRTPYCGVLYLGGMVVDDRVYVIEFNARWGDPEAQVIVPGIRNNFFELNLAAAQGNIASIALETDKKARVCIAGVSRGYPDDYSAVKGKQVTGLDIARTLPDVTIYPAGMRRVGDMIQAFGGRLLFATGKADNAREAKARAMDALRTINVEGDNFYYRTDIGDRDIPKLQTTS